MLLLCGEKSEEIVDALPGRLRRTLMPVGDFLTKRYQPDDPANGAFNIVFKSNADKKLISDYLYQLPTYLHLWRLVETNTSFSSTRGERRYPAECGFERRRQEEQRFSLGSRCIHCGSVSTKIGNPATKGDDNDYSS